MLVPVITALYSTATIVLPSIQVDESQLRLTEVASLDGSEFGVDFIGIGSIEATEEGSFFVFDPVAQSLFLFGADGRWAKEIGRKGEGPGEFVRGHRMLVSGDHFTIFDLGQNLLHSFTTAGEFVASRRAPTVGGTVLSTAQELRGGHWLGVSSPSLRFNRANGKIDTPGRVMVLPTDGDNPVVLLEYVTVATIFYDKVRRTPWGIARPGLFGDSGQWDLVGDSVVVVADGMSGVVEWYRVDSQGHELVNRIETGFLGQPISATHRRRLIALDREQNRNASPDTDWLFPATAPGIGKVIVDSQGFVWIKRQSLEVGGSQIWRVFAPGGERWGDSTLPAEVEVRDIANDRIFGVATEGLDVSVIKVFEFDRSQLMEVMTQERVP